MARILLVSPISNQGGPIYILQKIIECLQHRHQTIVVATGHGELFSWLEQQNIRGISTPLNGLNRQAIPWLMQLIYREKIDVVYGASFCTAARNALVAAKLTGRPYIWHINEMLMGPREVSRGKSFFLRFADELIADAEASVSAVQQYVPARHVNLIYNGIEPAEFSFQRPEARQYLGRELNIPADHAIVLNAGWICERKGQLYSLQAAMDVLKTNPLTTFIFLGSMELEPEYGQHLIDQVTVRQLQDRIRFVGFRDDFPHLVAGADIFLHTAIKDPFPVVILGAMAAQTPVVAFDIEGVREQVVDGQTGRLVPGSDVIGIATALQDLLDSSDARLQMGEKALQRVIEHFTSESMAKAVVKLIEEQAAHRS